MSQNQGPGDARTSQPGEPYQPPQRGPQPYGQPSSYPAPGQPYGQPGGLAPVAGYTPSRAEKRSPVLGALALVLVVVCGIALSWAMWRFGGLVGQLAVNGTVDLSNQQELQQALVDELGGVWAWLVWGSVTAGFAGWVMGIVAAATKRGTGLGVTAIVVGALAPFAAVGVLVAALAPYASS